MPLILNRLLRESSVLMKMVMNFCELIFLNNLKSVLNFDKPLTFFKNCFIFELKFHELTGNRSGEWACDLDQPYRLVFRAGESTDGKKWIEITSAEILEIVDYHK